MTIDQDINLDSVRGGIPESPLSFKFQYYARDYYDAYKNHRDAQRSRPSFPKFSPARLNLIALSIELAAKALHLDQGEPKGSIEGSIYHDLTKACDQDVLTPYGITLTEEEKNEIEKANVYYRDKGFQYFEFLRPRSELALGVSNEAELALRGYPGLPDETLLESALNKLLTPNL
jgi:hypothetical protein